MGEIMTDGFRERVEAVLRAAFPNGPNAVPHYADLLFEYAASGLAAPHILSELETRDPHKLHSNIWEAMLYRHLVGCGHTLRNFSRRAGQSGPDFGVEWQGRTIWIEAVVPEPKGIPPEYIEPPQPGRVYSIPDFERVLRCTQVISDKRRRFEEYQSKGIVGPNDCTVIAVNVSRLLFWDSDGMGISQRPLCAEAVFPIGPLQAIMTRSGEVTSPLHNGLRHEIEKANGAKVETMAFLDPAFANVSAVLQAYQSSLWDGPLILYTIHNPLSAVELPRRLFDARIEIVGTPVDDGYQLTDIAAEAVSTQG